jgi:hypothetical protein
VVKDEKGRPIPATLKDIGGLLGVDKGNITRMAQKLIAQGSMLEGKLLRLVFAPAPPDSETVVSTDNSSWNVAGVVVSIDNLPEDPEERAEAVRFLELRSTAWKERLLVVKTEERELLRQGLSSRGIIIDKKNQKNRRKELSSSSSEQPVEPDPPPLTEQPIEPTTTAPALESLESRIVRVFFDAGKDNPSPKQMREAVGRLPADPRAGDAFLESLESKIERIKHGGGLESAMSTFLLGWPAKVQQLDIADELKTAREREHADAVAWAAAEAAHASSHGPLMVDPFPEIPPEPEAAPTPTHKRPLIDEEAEASRRATVKARKEAEKAQIEERKKQLGIKTTPMAKGA